MATYTSPVIYALNYQCNNCGALQEYSFKLGSTAPQNLSNGRQCPQCECEEGYTKVLK